MSLYTAKIWQDQPSQLTPLSGQAVTDLENRLANFINLRVPQSTPNTVAMGAASGDIVWVTSTAIRASLGLGTAALLDSSVLLQKANNLNELSNVAQARANLSLGSAALSSTTAFLQPANNLSEIPSASQARTNLGLGNLATQNNVNFMTAANNLSELTSTPVARKNLGLGQTITITGTYSVSSNDWIVLCDASTGPFIINLPNAVSFNSLYIFKAITSNTNIVQVAPQAGQAVDGVATPVTLGTKLSSAAYNSFIIASDNSNWRII